MDMFMDKLAQKLNAQEMIKANLAADAEEMNQLKGKVKEYSDCLEQVQKLAEEGLNKLEAATVDCSEVEGLVDGVIAKVDEAIAKIDGLKGNEDTKKEELVAAQEELKKQLLEDLEAFKKDIAAKVDSSSDNVHKECVKVYRNVQAVLVEENNKQTESLKEVVSESVATNVKGFRGKLNAVLAISIISMILAAGSVVLQVLNMMGFKFF